MKIERVDWDGRDAPAPRHGSGRSCPRRPRSAMKLRRSSIESGRAARRASQLASGFGGGVAEELRVDPQAIEAAQGLLEPVFDVRPRH